MKDIVVQVGESEYSQWKLSLFVAYTLCYGLTIFDYIYINTYICVCLL